MYAWINVLSQQLYIFSPASLSIGRGTLDSCAAKGGLGGATDGGGAHAIV